MLGKYVYVIQNGEGTLALCEVKVNVNGKFFVLHSFVMRESHERKLKNNTNWIYL